MPTDPTPAPAQIHEPAQAQIREAIETYLAGAPPESDELDFLVGEWETRSRRFRPDGTLLVELAGRWRGEWLLERRLLLDCYRTFAPDGREIGASVTLRTYCPSSRAWVMTFLTPLQPDRLISFGGQRVGDELHLAARATDLRGHEIEARVRFYDISTDAFRWDQLTRPAGSNEWHREIEIVAKRCG